jgi:hypothetical protein
MDQQLPTGYFLQAAPEGGYWRLYDIGKKGECRICHINAAGDNLDIEVISEPYEAALKLWDAGVQANLICTNRIIELLWQQQAPQEISDQLAKWHREDEARDFAALQSPIALTFTAKDEERDFREWMDSLNDRRDCGQELSAEERLHAGLGEFYAEEKEMERQLGAEADAENLWLDQWEVPEEPEDAEEESLESEEDLDNYPDEVEPETPGYQEWDDADNFWNQEGVFEEMSDLYTLNSDYY